MGGFCEILANIFIKLFVLKKLKEKNIPFETITDVDVMTSKGLSSAPALEIEGKLYNFKDSINWVNSQE